MLEVTKDVFYRALGYDWIQVTMVMSWTWFLRQRIQDITVYKILLCTYTSHSSKPANRMCIVTNQVTQHTKFPINTSHIVLAYMYFTGTTHPTNQRLVALPTFNNACNKILTITFISLKFPVAPQWNIFNKILRNFKTLRMAYSSMLDKKLSSPQFFVSSTSAIQSQVNKIIIGALACNNPLMD